MRIIPTSRSIDLPAGKIASGPSRALVPAAAAAPVSEAPITPPDARFVAQLIATAAHMQQPRGRRRTEIADGAMVYGEVATITEPPPRPAQGCTLTRMA